jgi:leukotriene A-4 hydrolase/aminopeptidase
MKLSKDIHSFGNPNEIAVKHMHLDLSVDFDKKVLSGSVRLDLDNKTGDSTLILDTRQLTIKKVTLDNGAEAEYKLAEDQAYFGSALSISVLPETKSVTIAYETDPEAEALQWLSPEQTHGKVHPFLFSQSQAILARTWIPCQDGPGVKFTYSARIQTAPELLALMSAENGNEKSKDGVYFFKMDQPVSSYLMALTVGDLSYQSTGRNSGVFAEPGMLKACAWEFEDMQSMIDSAEELYGPYQWGQYDVVVLPPSFPFGGMENPRLTFATPTIIAGDRSLVSLIAHELAHSWSGNLVTNETWNDFWLNEGFTVYFEQRIMEKIYGKEFADMETKLGMGGLKETLASLNAEGKGKDTHLYLDLAGRNPDDGLTDVAYEKGRFFLQTIEAAVGREAFDVFLKAYFTENAFKPMNTERFIAYLNDHLIKGDTALAASIQINNWIYGPDLPSNAPNPQSSELDRVDAQATAFLGGAKAASLDTKNWSTHHWLYFLRAMPDDLNGAQMTDLDKAFGFTKSGNSEILCDWFQRCVQSNYQTAYPAMEKFLINVGRRKFLTPIYSLLVKTPEGKTFAKAVFEKAKPGYHSVAENTIADLLNKNS